MSTISLMHPGFMNCIVYVVLPFVAISQWILLLGMAIRENIVYSLDNSNKVSEIKHDHDTILLPLSKDTFFILWNIFPLFLISSYIYMNIYWGDWTEDLLRLNNSDIPEMLQSAIDFRTNPLLLSIMVLISIFAGLFQLKKQKLFDTESQSKKRKSIYWWDREICRTIFYIRLVSLIFNMFTVLFVILSAIVYSIFLINMVNLDNINVIFFHNDNFGGLNVIGEISIVLSGVFLFTSGLGIVALYDHGFKQGFVHSISDILAFLVVIPAIFIIIYPTIKNNEILSTKLDAMTVYSDKEIFRLNSEFLKMASDYTESGEAIEDWIENNSQKVLFHRDILKIDSVPLNLSSLVGLITTWLVPLFIWISLNSIERSKKLKKNNSSNY